MATIIKPPEHIRIAPGNSSVFLAGSIEMGTADNWQSTVESAFAYDAVTILNPRRDDWDTSWVQSISNPQFRKQVEWELSGLEQATVIAMYFAPQTKSPITLLELGLAAQSGRLIVCCPDGYWRKGNIEVVCARYDVSMAANTAELVTLTKARLEI